MILNRLTIVMYHYVRPIRNSAFPRLRGLELSAFVRQLEYLSSRYVFVTAEDVIAAVKGAGDLPPNACWLTFDDGYKDHFSFVLPQLLERRIQGTFFPPVKPVVEREMLDVNRIHHILASALNLDSLVQDLNHQCYACGLSAPEIEDLWRTYAVASRYDVKEVIYFKRLLQHALPEAVRLKIAAALFEKYVSVEEARFAEELYMSERDVKFMVDAGMHIGSHGYSHLWLNRETKAVQKNEIDLSLAFLRSVGAPTYDWVMCYPYGAYNESTLDVLRETNCAVGVTTKVGEASLMSDAHLELPRFDTNDFPQ